MACWLSRGVPVSLLWQQLSDIFVIYRRASKRWQSKCGIKDFLDKKTAGFSFLDQAAPNKRLNYIFFISGANKSKNKNLYLY